MKNTLIRFESQAYKVQLQAYEKKLELEGVIARELKARIGIDFKAQDLFPDTELKLFKLIVLNLLSLFLKTTIKSTSLFTKIWCCHYSLSIL